MSNSKIITNILDDENVELKNSINSFMESKLNEFKIIMKQNIETAITNKLDNFYGKSFHQHDNILFDKDGTEIIKKTNSHLDSRLREVLSYPTHVIYIKSQINIIEKMKNYKYFTLGNSSPDSAGGTNSCTYNFFKNVLIVNEYRARSVPSQPKLYLHNLTNDLLFTIKHFQLGVFDNVENGIKYFNEHREYFKTNCADFENICNKEYEIIKKQKDELQKLKDENVTKIEYYKSLELKINDIEKQEQKLDEERKKLMEEKNKMMIVKRKLTVMKAEIEKEKNDLEKEKK